MSEFRIMLDDDLEMFILRARILQCLKKVEIPGLKRSCLFRENPVAYLTSCPKTEAQHIWSAIRKMEK